MIQVFVDEVPVGASLLDAVRAAGQSVPTLCNDDRLTPAGSCRVCLVDADGNGLVAACSTPARDGLRIGLAGAASWRHDALAAVVSGLPA